MWKRAEHKAQAPIIKERSLQKLIMAYFLTGRKRFVQNWDAFHSGIWE